MRVITPEPVLFNSIYPGQCFRQKWPTSEIYMKMSEPMVHSTFNAVRITDGIQFKLEGSTPIHPLEVEVRILL